MKVFNRTHLEHALYALAMQVVIGVVTGDWLAGAAFGAAFFLGREHAQAEERYIRANGGRRYETPNNPAIAGLSPKYWTLDSVFDFISPIAAVTASLLTIKIMAVTA